MSKFTTIVLSAALTLGASPALATTVTDPVGDFAPTYTGPLDADLDVTSFTVQYLTGSSTFQLSATFAGLIDTAKLGFYVIGANTGTGTNSFAAIGLGNVRFNQAIVIQKDGSAAIAGVALPAGSVTIAGNGFTALVPLSRLPPTGFVPADYGFNLWPRTAVAGITGNAAISDFAPNNATIASSPEPSTWAMLVLGFGAVGIAMRRRHRIRASVAYA